MIDYTKVQDWNVVDTEDCGEALMVEYYDLMGTPIGLEPIYPGDMDVDEIILDRLYEHGVELTDLLFMWDVFVTADVDLSDLIRDSH